MILLHSVLLAGGLYYFFKRSKVEDKFLFWSAWLLRLAMAIAVGLVYTYYYDANDTWNFFEDAKKLSSYGRMNGIDYIKFLFTGNSEDVIWQTLSYTQERSLFLVKIVSVLALFTGDSYWISALYFATISFLAAWFLFTTVITHFDGAKTAAAIAFLLFPSVVFWSSGLVKETLALAGIFWMSALFIKVMKGDKMNIVEIVIGLAAFWVAWNLKYYWAAMFLVVVFTSLIIYLLQRYTVIKSYWWMAWGLLFFMICTLATQVHPNFYFSRLLEVIVTNHNAFVQISKPEGLIDFYNLKPEWLSMALNSPWALFSGLFRPWMGEVSKITTLLAATENLFLVVLFVSTGFSKSWKTNNSLLLLSVITYIALLCILMALSTPNLGTLSRYRVGFLPFFVFVIAYGNPLLKRIRL